MSRASSGPRTSRPPGARRWDWAALATLALLAASGLAGCVRLAPYQRGRLAHPTMLLGDVAGAAESHVYAVQEGATGGGATAEGGCGCN